MNSINHHLWKKVYILTPTSVLVTVAHCKTYDEPVEAVVDDAYA